MIEKFNSYVGILIGVLIIFYMFYRLFYGIIYKMGGHKKIEEINNDLKIKNFETKEKEKLMSYYLNKTLSVSDLLLLTNEQEYLKKQLKENEESFHFEIKIGEQYNGLIKCYLLLDKKEIEGEYTIKSVDIKEVKNITNWQNN